MTQITIDIKSETAQHIHAMLPNHPGMTFPQLAGAMLDKQVAYRLEVERMKPATFGTNEYTVNPPFGGTY